MASRGAAILRGGWHLFTMSDEKAANADRTQLQATSTPASDAAAALSREELELRRLVQHAAQNDRPSAERFAREMLPRVRNLVRYFVRGDAEVDDLSQEALVTLLRALGTYRGEGNVSAWSDRIVVRVVFAHLRRRRATDKMHIEYKADVIEMSEHESGARFLARRRAMRALDELPDEQRAVVVMHHVLGLSVREIAEELDAAFETVRSRMRLGMARLRSMLGEEDETGGTP